MKSFSDLGIILGDSSPVNVSKFVTACLNNKLSSEAIQSFILASKDILLYLQPIITQYFIDNKSEIWSLSLIVHSKG